MPAPRLTRGSHIASCVSEIKNRVNGFSIMLFEALPIIIITALVVEGVSFFVPAVKNFLGVIGPILIALGAMGWRLLGSSTNLIVAGFVVIIARYAFFVYFARQEQN